MTLPSGAHIAFKNQAGVYTEFDIAEDIGSPNTLIRPHYEHRWEPIFATRTDVSGRPGTQNLVPEFPLWINTDWVGGEGLKFMTDATKQFRMYDNGTGNGRYPGQFQGAPTKTIVNPAGGTPYGVLTALQGLSKAWVVSVSADAWYSTDLTNWTRVATGVPAGNIVTAACGSPNHIYVAETTSNKIYRFNASAQATFANAGLTNPQLGLAFSNSSGAFLYAWDGCNLMQFDATQSLPVTGNKVYSMGLTTLPPPHGGALNTDNSVCMFSSTENGTEVHEYKDGAGRRIWGPDGFGGFSARAMTFANGVLYLVGLFDNQAVLWGMSMADRKPQFLGYIRQTTGSSLIPASASAGFGAQALFSMQSGEVFVYDEENDAISELDTAGQFVGGSSGVSCWGMKRYLAFTSAGAPRVHWWNDDIATTTRQGQYISPAYDYDIPEENKTLLGFYVDCAPMSGSQTIQVEYQTNENGSYVSAGTINSGTTNASSGFAYITVSAAPTFRLLRLRVTVNNGAILYAITARAYILNYIEKWEMVIRLKDEMATTSAGTGVPTHPTSRDIMAEQQRYFLVGDGTNPFGITGIINSKQPVTFYDGYIAKKAGVFGTYTVMVELPQDQIHRDTQGIMRIQLRSIAP